MGVVDLFQVHFTCFGGVGWDEVWCGGYVVVWCGGVW